MESIKDIQLAAITNDKIYWNCSRPIQEECMYFLLIDRFHDGKERTTTTSQVGYGSAEELQRRCKGTLRGIIKQLEYISEMGMTSIWLNPFQQNNFESYHGYAIENFLEVDKEWGTKDDLIELVTKAHALNMRVFFDVVLNHTGDNWSYIKNQPVYQKGKTYTTKSWRYSDKPIPSELRNFNCYNRKGRIKDWEAIPETWEGDIYELKDLIQDASSQGDSNLEVMVAIYSYWFALTDCDGFRIDAAKHIPPNWLNTFIEEIKRLALGVGKKNFFIFAEIISNLSVVEKYKAIDGYLDFDFYFTSVDRLLHKNEKQIGIHQTSLDAIPIRFLDNHDQIGQKIKRRIASNTNKSQFLNLLKVFLMMPGVPCIYYGTEQGLKGKGKNDSAIRECMFDPFGSTDVFNKESVFYKTIKQFSKFREEWGMQLGIVESCIVEHLYKGDCIALQISNLTQSKLVLYNLNSENELVNVKLARPMSRNNKLVVYLSADSKCLIADLKVEGDTITRIPIAPNDFIVLDIGMLA
ncbi:alpha-amylase family glycosyl hydrolase [uncultured Cytophaga sp.]|uniref:alpha-amylase family glycosyl hydrolase n=1 Tax=uncultured Cytophaga sp. TaxID=160238 RepID=UPI00262DF25B|nr:alpha-amylase family glycosyl hydrolase [uncultured Cytophaga sp.]